MDQGRRHPMTKPEHYGDDDIITEEEINLIWAQLKAKECLFCQGKGYRIQIVFGWPGIRKDPCPYCREETS